MEKSTAAYTAYLSGLLSEIQRKQITGEISPDLAAQALSHLSYLKCELEGYEKESFPAKVTVELAPEYAPEPESDPEPEQASEPEQAPEPANS